MTLRINRRALLRSAVAAVAASGGGKSRTAWAQEVREHILPVTQVSRGPRHHFVGYYDKTPFSADGRYLVAHRSSFADRQPMPGEALDIGIIDLEDHHRFLPLDRTTAWSWQQGAMLQWLGSAPDRLILYNRFEEDAGAYRATIRDIHDGSTRTLPRPIYALSPDGSQAVSLPFDRLNRLRPGYGYMATPERFPNDPAPAEDGLWKIDVATGADQLIVPIRRAVEHEPLKSFLGAEHWFNHALFSPGGAWVTFLHRWKKPDDRTWTTRMLVVRPDGSDLRVVWDTGMVSHFDWRDDRTILAWNRTPDGKDCFTTRDVENGAWEVFGERVLTRDGHCSYSPDRRWILNDTYPDQDRLQTLMLVRVADGQRIDIGRFLEPPTFTGPYRCDLHPRWNRDGTMVCIDSTHEEAQRQIYVLDVRTTTQG